MDFVISPRQSLMAHQKQNQNHLSHQQFTQGFYTQRPSFGAVGKLSMQESIELNIKDRLNILSGGIKQFDPVSILNQRVSTSNGLGKFSLQVNPTNQVYQQQQQQQQYISPALTREMSSSKLILSKKQSMVVSGQNQVASQQQNQPFFIKRNGSVKQLLKQSNNNLQYNNDQNVLSPKESSKNLKSLNQRNEQQNVINDATSNHKNDNLQVSTMMSDKSMNRKSLFSGGLLKPIPETARNIRISSERMMNPQSPDRIVSKPKKHLTQIGMLMQKAKKARARPLRNGTLTIINQAAIDMKAQQQGLKNHQSESGGGDNDVYLAGNKKAMPEQAKIKLKWKTIQYLLENKKPQIEMLTSNLKELITEVKDEKKSKSLRAKRLGTTALKIFSNIGGKRNSADGSVADGDKDKENNSEDDKGLNRDEFARLLSMIGLGTDKNLIEKLFWIFDDDGNGEVDHKELAVGLEMLKENTFADKLDRFFDICDEDNSGTIDKKEFYNLLKLSMVNYEDVSSLKSLVGKLFAMVDKRGTGEITKQEMQYACQNNQQIKDLIEKNVKILKEVDHWIESDLEKPFHTRITFTLGSQYFIIQQLLHRNNSKSKGVYYPSINKLVSALEERESIIRNSENIKEEYRIGMRKIRGIQHDEESEDEY
eukprot:403376350